MRRRDAPSAMRRLSSWRRAERPREQQIREVRARNQQHQTHDDHDRRQRPAVALAKAGVAVAAGSRRNASLRKRSAPRDASRPAASPRGSAAAGRAAARCRRFGALSRLQPDHDPQPPARTLLERPRAANQRHGADRHGDVERPADVDAKELRRRHADDREGHALDGQRTADGVRRAAEAPLPEGVADDRDRTVRPAARPIVLRR